MESLKKFEKLGFVHQPPTLTDKTHFFIRHSEAGMEQLWIQIRKLPRIEYTVNLKAAEIPKQIDSLINEFLIDVGY